MCAPFCLLSRAKHFFFGRLIVRIVVNVVPIFSLFPDAVSHQKTGHILRGHVVSLSPTGDPDGDEPPPSILPGRLKEFPVDERWDLREWDETIGQIPVAVCQSGYPERPTQRASSRVLWVLIKPVVDPYPGHRSTSTPRLGSILITSPFASRPLVAPGFCASGPDVPSASYTFRSGLSCCSNTARRIEPRHPRRLASRA
jgi:hypothetical protein